MLLAVAASAKVTLPEIISDNMVLQRNSDVTLWGKADPGAVVKVTLGWDGTISKAKAGKDGRWSLTVKTTEAGGPYDIIFSDGTDVKVSNVMLGEVWFCGGQSNMVMPMDGFRSQPVEGAVDYIVKAKASRPIRVCNIKRKTSLEPLGSARTSWQLNTPENVAKASATAYFFAEYLNEVLDVPVGVITSAWGGSTIEAWMSREVLEKFPEVNLPDMNGTIPEKSPQQVPTVLFNGMVSPIVPYTVKGFLLYQGEANKGSSELYGRLLPAYVEMMRNLWGNDALPFYYVQVAPFKYSGRSNYEGAMIREAQLKALDKIPHSGMVVTHDIGDEFCVHPAKKAQVGQRLALLALSKDYGLKGFDAESPVYKSMKVEGDEVTVTFKVSGKGVGPKGAALTGFEVAGEDRVFHPASAKVKSVSELVVKSKHVSAPVAVRYGFHNAGDPATVFNSMGIPASPFRTDDWEVKETK